MRRQPHGFEYTVILTTFRRTLHLAEALAGIASQTLPPAQVIVADDGSGEPFESDNRRLAEQFGFVYLQLPHTGLPGLARDRALAMVSTPWVALSDDDDVWDADHIAVLSAAITDDSVIVAGNARRSDTGADYRSASSESLDLIAEFPKNPVITSAALIRVSGLLQVGGFTPYPRGAEDYAAWLRLATVGSTVVVERPTIMYRITPGSLSAEASRGKRPLPLLCAADFLIWSYGKRLTLRRLPTKLWTLVMRRFLVRAASALRDS